MASLIGLFTLGRDAELRSTSQGEQVATLALAYNYGRKGADGKQPTQWVKAALWGERAGKLTDHMTKGRQFYMQVEDLHVATFKKSDGTEGVSLEGRVGQVEFVRAGAPAAEPPPPPRPSPRPAPRPAPAVSGFEDMDDDIPF